MKQLRPPASRAAGAVAYQGEQGITGVSAPVPHTAYDVSSLHEYTVIGPSPQCTYAVLQ